MFDRVEFDRINDDGTLETVRMEDDGPTVIFRADREADIIRYKVETAIADYELRDEATVKVEDVGDGWSRVEYTYKPGVDWDGNAMNLSTDVDIAFSKSGKGYYQTRDKGQNQDGSVTWYVVKHVKGHPWI